VSFELPVALLPAGDYVVDLQVGGDTAGRYPFRYAPAV
jgi:hypothetical protein